MVTDVERLLALYERGVVTRVRLVDELIRVTREHPIAELVARLPEEVVAAIRDKAAVASNAEWFLVRSVCNAANVDLAASEASEREDRARWADGLALWRDYFGFAG